MFLNLGAKLTCCAALGDRSRSVDWSMLADLTVVCGIEGFSDLHARFEAEIATRAREALTADVLCVPPAHADGWLRLLDASSGRGAGMRGDDDPPYVPPFHFVGSGATLRCDDVPYLPPVHVAGALRLVDAGAGSGATVSSDDALWVVAANDVDWLPLANPEPSVSSSSCTTASRALSGSSSVALSIAMRSWNSSAGEY